MIERSEAFRAAITADARRIDILAVVDISDPDMTITALTGSALAPWSQPETLHDHITDAPKRYATLEHNRWILDGSFSLFPDDFKVPESMGAASDALCGADGVFSEPIQFQQTFRGVGVLQSYSLAFSSDPADGVPTDFTVEILQGGTVYYTKTFSGNTDVLVTDWGFAVYGPDTIRLTVTRWSMPYRRARVVEIYPGTYEEWDGDMLAELAVKQQGDPSCATLPYGTCTLKMDNLSRRFDPRAKNGIFQSLEERQSIEIYIGARLPDGTRERVCAGVFYQSGDGWKTSDNDITMQWSLVDIIGLLNNRAFRAPETLPTTLGGWLAALAAQLGDNFAGLWHVDPGYIDTPATVREESDVSGKKCGEILKWVCQATGTWPRADAETGYLTAEPLWNQGNKVTLDNLNSYPTMKANKDLAAIFFTLNDGAGTQYIVSGNSTTSGNTLSISNPFIQSQSQALTAARGILTQYGGNVFDLTGRGDPASEIGDVDTVWLDEQSAATARRIMQTFSFSDGVMQGCKSQLLQADGSFLYQNRAVLTASGTWTVPAGVSSLRVILVGPGGDGTDGTDGTWSKAGVDGVDGAGGAVWTGTVYVNSGQTLSAVVTREETRLIQSEGVEYSAADGERYEYGYTDIANGSSFARTGVENPRSGSGDGGLRGFGGEQGHRTRWSSTDADGTSHSGWDVDNYPGKGTPGTAGATGCVVIYWDKE